MVEERLTDREREVVVEQLRRYWERVMQVFDHSYSSQVHRRWWPAFVLLDDMKDHLPFLIDWIARGKLSGYESGPREELESLIEFEEREDRFRDPRRAFRHDQKRDIWFSAGGRCSICRVPLGPDWHADHIEPWSRGGGTETSNGQALCPACNRRKHAKVLTVEEG